MPKERVLGFPSASVSLFSLSAEIRVCAIDETPYLDLTGGDLLDIVENEVHQLVETLELTGDFAAAVELDGDFLVEISTRRTEARRKTSAFEQYAMLTLR
jgi:hypothetical protein